MLLTLQTLKAKPFQEQIRTIELLTEQNLDLFERIRPLAEGRSEDSVFQTRISGDRQKVVRVALLAVVAADITTIPDQGAREPYHRKLDDLCNHFAIDIRDVTNMTQYTSEIESFLEGRSQPIEAGSNK